ncbi:iron-siderophore ABC transporter substrate-binding protein [Clostridium beijerinckii]|uniref:Iron-siderophore ABC transporter substrate-binding protein n=1 Tax=Clostridium beijerinckii TaxID=1520 RepID=A0AAW3W5J5_CLOBE|nr:iron-siderophore ABC transporter substrate-binding protein [Clostridium beijerinckii]MBC2456686.1 iron-siderophore ABC transporter substrate-binding protein [Clostridium beijerinckii]MBC2473986.1 iron-siderophore ABC transporter substrate-binding protein [Clostridium beijerinckii]NOV61340.1 iron complex transport system substrate-binding protein [Clostridium beijerinckii]NOV69166.1 iron complex transport system substrate-binding protein [Clostridium beijerinckii]NOW32794.1 iron complex tran
MKLKGITTIILACTLLITGCSSGAAKNEDKSNVGQSATVTYPLTIKHAFGETVIEKQPEKVVTISWGNQDVPLALGVVPAGVSKANYGKADENGLLPWTAEKYKELGVDKPVTFDDVDGLDYEAISNAKPDVILAAYSGITQEEYDLLSKIAPVVAYPKLPWQTYWRDQISINSTAMGKKDEGDKLVLDLEKQITEKTSEYPKLKGKKAVFCYFNPADLGKFYIYLPTDPRAAYLTDLGLELPESVKKLAQTSDSFALEISSENIDKLTDVDVMVTYGNDTLVKQLQSDALLGTVPAIKRGSVAVIEDGSALAASCIPTALSIPATIDEYLKIIGEAADKA